MGYCGAEILAKWPSHGDAACEDVLLLAHCACMVSHMDVVCGTIQTAASVTLHEGLSVSPEVPLIVLVWDVASTFYTPAAPQMCICTCYATVETHT